MENFKSTLFSIVIFAIFMLAIYWAFSTIESGSAHVDNQAQKELIAKNESLQEEIIKLKNEIKTLEDQNTKTEVVPETEVTKIETVKDEIVKKPVVETPTVLKYQSLINELQKLVDGKYYMKKGSKGTMVGTLQKFLNIYNNASNKVDNDYGVNMVTNITKFQKNVGLTADGQTGPTTYLKMIDWLKKQ
jgi:murein L,D-transpeptidase YcbB/YkuD